METLEINKKQIINTQLFTEVDLKVKNWTNNNIDIVVSVKERWYTFPLPIFELADRNFNVWLEEHNLDFARTNYGIRFYQENVRGRNELLKAVFQLGYTQKFELFYTFPYFDKKQKNGLKFSISYSRNKQVAYKTEFNKLQFYPTDIDKLYFNRQADYLRTLRKRRAIYHSHFFQIMYHNNEIGDSIVVRNSDYFLKANTDQKYFEIKYKYVDDHRDIKAYPLRGYIYLFELTKTGIRIFDDVNIFSVQNIFSKYIALSKRVFFASQIITKSSFPKVQPYFNQRSFGYLQEYVRGYELYVIDGQHFGLAKATLKYELLSIKLNSKSVVPIDKFNDIPLAIYLKTYADMGYVQDNYYFENNPRNNLLLFGGGIGIDISTYYDIVLRIEYSFNNLYEKGLYLHFKIDI